MKPPALAFSDYLEAYHERAGIMQYDARMDRPRAESLAALQVRRLYAINSGIDVDNPDAVAFGNQIRKEGRVK